MLQGWEKSVAESEVVRAIEQLKIAFIADRVVLGGGNAKLIEELPDGVELGHNRNVYPGGCGSGKRKPKASAAWRII